MQVVFFDSGVGGLTVLYEAMNILPHENFVYFADTDNVPYGTKPASEIRNLVFDALNHFNPDKIKAVVLACNTATSVAVDDLRKHFSFPIIGMEPAIKPATLVGSKKILVCATERTLELNKLNDLIDDLKVSDRVEKLSLQELVMFGEHFNFYDPSLEVYLHRKFAKINWNDFDAIVLGCTHFLFFLPHLRKIIPHNVEILDGNLGTALRLKSLIKENEKSESGLSFVRSGRAVSNIDFDNYIRYYKEIKE